MTDLERFTQWCKSRGHYQAAEAVERFLRYEANMKARECEALRERVKDE